MDPIAVAMVGQLLALFLVAGVLWALPNWRQPDSFFSITVPPALTTSDAGQRILARYRRRVLIAAVAILILIVVSLVQPAESEVAPYLSALLILGLGAVSLVSFLAARRATQQVAAAWTGDRATDSAAATQAPTDPGELPQPGLPLILQLGPVLLLGLMALFVGSQWASIPDPFISSWNASFEPAGWSPRTPLDVFRPLILAAVIVVMLLGIGASMGRSWRRNPARSLDAAQRRQRILQVLVAAGYLLALVLGPISWTPLVQDPAEARGFAFATTMVGLGGGLGFAAFTILWLAPAFSASGRSETPADTPASTDAAWKLGLIYFNPQDPTLWVEKRIGIGYTLNFGRPAAWLLLLTVLLVPILLVRFLA